MEILRAENNEFVHLKKNDLSSVSNGSSTIDEDDDDDRSSNISVSDEQTKSSPSKKVESSSKNDGDLPRQNERLAAELKDYEDRWIAHRNFLLYSQALSMKSEDRDVLFSQLNSDFYKNSSIFGNYPMWPNGTAAAVAATTTTNGSIGVAQNQPARSPTSDDDDSGNQSNSGSTSEWTFEEQFRQLYELSDEPKRKEFLDDLFAFMQKRGTPVNRIPIMAKHVLDLYELFRLVVAKGGLVEVINKKLWREITKGLNLPSSITSAAFTLRTQYMKYLYPYECEKLQLSAPSELQAAIEGNRREGRRPSYAFDYSSPPQILSGPGGNGAPPVPNAFRSIDSLSAAAALSHHPFFLAAAAASSRDLNHSTGRIPSFDEHHHHHHHHLQSLSSPSSRSSNKRTLSPPPSFLCKSINEETTNVNLSTNKKPPNNTTTINNNFNTRSSSFTPIGTISSTPNKINLIAKENNTESIDQKSIQISIEFNGVVYQGTLYASTMSTQFKD